MKRSIYLITFLAFILRFGLGVTAFVALPQLGYESKPQQAGYLFFDAYRRDSQAWDLAVSGKPLARAFDQKFASDQYGGLLWISAFTYRYLSAGTHLPLLLVFLAALIGSLGVIFVYLSAKRLMDEKSAFLASLIFAFFPEAILQGASQMREPFLMTFVAMAFYGLVEWQATRAKNPLIWTVLALVGMFFISPGFILVTLVAAAGWLYFFVSERSDSGMGRKIPWQALVVAAGIFVLALVAVAASWDSLVTVKGGGVLGIIGGWARGTAKWNTYLLGRSSGIVQLLFQALPSALAMPFVAIYGILQPVLPAAVFEPTVPFWQTLGIIRALGWYLLLPLVAFAPFSAGILHVGQRPSWRWLSLVVWGWILVAAVRGGGDQWDNPRYRVILLIWLSMLAAQAFYAVKSASGRWFWRIVGVETIILLVFGHWYSWRYLGFGFNLGIRNTLVIAIGLAMLVVLGDWLWQRSRAASRL
ncbi:MAG: glycosyltransferase family 39 protein [Chloroflexi bacterium]|nr:glycosyltransferase family 39 protein [Chloroflexota bacterium]